MAVWRADERGVIVPCPSCGRANRLAFDQLGKHARCQVCHADLSLPDGPVEVSTSAHFDALIRRSVLPVLVDFWAPWCGPCRMVSPQVEQVAAQRRGQWLVAKVNTDQVKDLAQRLRIMSIPTLAVFAGGREAARTSGAMNADRIDAFVRGALGSRTSS